MYTQIIDSDGKGYYAYLPAIFIYHDLSFNFFEEKKNNKIARYFNPRFLTPANGKTVLKTYCGQALLLVPFFTAGCMLQYAVAQKVNGYEPLIQFFVCLGALFYLGLGLYYIKKILSFYIQNIMAINATLILITLGTNLFYYAAFHPSMTHVYSFAINAAFIFYIKNFFENRSNKNLYIAAMLLGITSLIRPVNILIVLMVPFLTNASGIYQAVQQLISIAKSKALNIAMLLFLIPAFIQPLLNYLQCGQFIVWSYGNEGFYFLHPQISNVLFSFRKGLFIYSPVLMISVAGLFFIFKRNRILFAGITLTLFSAIYLIAAWWNWYYGPGFGHRAFTDWYAVFAIPFAFCLDIKNNKIKKTLISFGFICLALNIFQTWQYLWGIIHPEEMNKEKYAYVFLKSSPHYINCLGGGNEDHYLPLNPKPVLQHTQLDNIFKFDSNQEFGCTFEFTDTAGIISQPVFFKASLSRLETQTDACRNALVVVEYANSKGETYYYNSLRINDLPRTQINEWKNFEYRLALPSLNAKGLRLKIYIWNRNAKAFLIKNFSAQLYTYDNATN